MPDTFVKIASVTVGSGGASSITLSAIPATYTDFVVKLSARTTRAANNEDLLIEFNGSGGTAYSSRRLYGTGSAAASDSGSSQAYIEFYSSDSANATTSTFGNAEIYVPNYAGSNNKSVSVDAVTENNATAAIAGLAAGLWANSAAITSIKFTPASGGSFVQYSTFYLYGVAKLGTTPAIVPYATGGDTIMTDGTYWYHAFLSSGTFTPAKGLSCDVLVVAGGGSGGLQYGGGGGAGGLVYTSSASLGNGTAYTITVGAGAPKAVDSGTRNGSTGSNSTVTGSGFTTITANGGGYGGGDNGNVSQAGGAGGSGGGGTGIGPGAGGSGSQGSNGGSGGGTGTYGGGGGGAGEAGNTDGNGFGGDGSSAYSSWGLATNTGQNVGGTYFYAGGGGGSANVSTPPEGGSGGGGAGGKASGGQTGGVAGTANTGGGGGAGWGGGDNSGPGGSGIVIVRYAV